MSRADSVRQADHLFSSRCTAALAGRHSAILCQNDLLLGESSCVLTNFSLLGNPGIQKLYWNIYFKILLFQFKIFMFLIIPMKVCEHEWYRQKWASGRCRWLRVVHYTWWKPNLGFLQGQFVVLPAQPFLQPPILLLLVQIDVFYQEYILHEIGKWIKETALKRSINTHKYKGKILWHPQSSG